MKTAGSVFLALAASSALVGGGCRSDKESEAELRQEIQALESERDHLRTKIDELMVRDPRTLGMPKTAVRVGIPTVLARELVEKVVAGFVDQVELVLTNLHVHKNGTVKKVVTLGAYDLDVTLEEIRGQLKTGRPDVRFGGNKVQVALPVTVASGTGRATIHFTWDGKKVAGALCGDLDITREVSGGVKPDSYPLQGGLVLSATAQQILAAPRFPKLRVTLKVEPSAESWATVQAVLDEKSGVCGFVLEKVDVLKIVRGIVDKGFGVNLPTEKLKAVAVPVGIEPTMTVRDKAIALGIRVGGLAITENTLWLGADVTVSSPDEVKPGS